MSAHTAQTELKLIGKLILEGELHCETGLHIGADLIWRPALQRGTVQHIEHLRAMLLADSR